MDSGTRSNSGTTSRRENADSNGPMEIPTVPPPAPPPEEHVPEIRGHSNSGGGDVAAKMKMVICGSSYSDPTKTKVIDWEHLFHTCRSILARSSLHRHYWNARTILRDDGIVGALCHFQGGEHSH